MNDLNLFVMEILIEERLNIKFSIKDAPNYEWSNAVGEVHSCEICRVKLKNRLDSWHLAKIYRHHVYPKEIYKNETLLLNVCHSCHGKIHRNLNKTNKSKIECLNALIKTVIEIRQKLGIVHHCLEVEFEKQKRKLIGRFWIEANHVRAD